MWVVKLGGSLLGTPELSAWLDMLARQSDGRVVIVPGGGSFADTVREVQRDSAFDDATAHHMALLAMEQYGLVMKSLQPELATASSELEIAERGWQHRAIVWLPSHMVLADDAVPKNWDVTSDSLAAWLAAKIGAESLMLVKHVDHLSETMPLALLTAAGLLDNAFGQFAASLSCPIYIAGKSHHAGFSSALAGGRMPGARILHN